MSVDVDAYLARIDYRGARTVGPELLTALHVAHQGAVPFETLSIHCGEGISLEDQALLDKLVARRRGGFCYELNGSFALLLEALGFTVQRLAGRVYGQDGALGIPFDHLALRVELAEPWLVDVGFGDGFLRPLRLQLGVEQLDCGRRYQLQPHADNGSVLELYQDGRPRYQFELTDYPLHAFAAGCAHHSTSPESPFARRPRCSAQYDWGRVTVAGAELIVTGRGGTQVRFPIVDDDAFDELVRLHFGVAMSASATGTETEC